MGPPAPKPARRRNRKRKRRAVSSSSSSSDDNSSSDESTQSTPRILAPPPKEPESDATSSSESTSSDSDSQSDDDDAATSTIKNQIPVDNPKNDREKGAPKRSSPSPPPPSTEIPSFIPSSPHTDSTARDQAMKDKFRKFWMASIAEGFKEDLEEIRKEPSLGSSRLALLIDSLAAGADVFTSSVSGSGAEMNEVDVVMGE